MFASAWVLSGLFAPWYRDYLWIVLLPAVPVVPLSIIFVKKRGLLYREYDACVLLDRAYRNDGTVTSYWERPELFPDEDAFKDIEEVSAGRLPRVSPGYFVRRYLPVLLFCGAALLIPARSIHSSSVNEVLDHEIELINKVLEMEQVMPEKDRAVFEEMVNKVLDQKSGVANEQWEALDQIKQTLAEEITANLIDATKLREMAKNFSATLETSEGSNASISEKQLLDMALAFQKALSESGELPDIEVEKLADALGKLCDAGMPGNIDIDKAKLAQALLDKAKLAEALKDLEGELGEFCAGLGECEGLLAGNRPGRGGINRGRGDAEMTYGEESELASAEYEDKRVENRYVDEENLTKVGLTRVEPETKAGAFIEQEVKTFGAVAGGHVLKTTISPSQQDVVKRYFSE